MRTKPAILEVLAKRGGPSKYALAKALGVRPIMIDHYLNGSRMKQGQADKFKELFDIELDDVYAPTQDAMERRKHEDDT